MIVITVFEKNKKLKFVVDNSKKRLYDRLYEPKERLAEWVKASPDG